MNILVFDDDDMIQTLFKHVISFIDPGTISFQAFTSKQAIGILNTEKIDIVFLDKHALGSCEIGMKSKELGLRVVLCTGDSIDNINFSEVLLKPFSIEDLQTIIKK
jgi:response regulator of citrate/malate metabolism